MKRLVSLFLSLVFVTGLCFSTPVIASAAETETKTESRGAYVFEYVEGSTEVAIKSWNGTANALSIDASVAIDGEDCKINKILSGAFSEAANLKSITLGKNIEYIEPGAFAGCDTLTSFVESGDSLNPNFSVVDGVLFDQGGTILIAYPAAKVDAEGNKKYIIPNNVTEITKDAFSGSEVALYVNNTNLITNGDNLEIHYGMTEGHEFGEYEITKNATCMEAGEKVRKCNYCAETEKQEIEIVPDAHTAETEWTVMAPTCVDDGERIKKCIHCNAVLQTEPIQKTGHSMGMWVMEKAPTCLEDGEMYCECQNENCTYRQTAKIAKTNSHTAGEWVVLTPATCDEGGVKVKKCTVCEAVLEEATISAGHTLGEWEVIKNATCKDEGVRERKCTVDGCEYKEQEAIEKLPHTEGAWIFVKDSTCSEEGKLEKKCTACGEIIETAVVPTKPHDFGEWETTKNATCTEAGEKVRKCNDCNETETEVTPALNHDFDEEFTIDTEPTCVTEGSKSKHCTRCDEKLEVTVIEPLGHDYENEEFTIDTEPTCVTEGSKSKHCTRCDEKLEVTVIEPLGHDYEKEEFTIDTAPTCVTEGSKSKHCTRCDERFEVTEIPATGHIDFVYETIKEATCTTAGSMLKKCKCGEELEIIVTSPKDHILSDWIVDKEATCTTAGSKHKECTLCEATLESGIIEILGHKYSDWTITKDATCETEGSKYRICSVCQNKETVVIESIAHKNATLVNQKEATCTEDGYSGDLYCPDCKETLEKGEVIKATGHTASDWIVDKEASFTEQGSQYKECTTCNAELEKAIIEKLTLDTPVVTIENSSSGIKVKWTTDEDAAGYTVYSSQYNTKTKKWSGWTNRGTTKATASSWTDKKVSHNGLYKYTVRAVNGKFKSEYKSSESLKFITAPKATVTISTTGLLIKWNKISSADSYIVYRSEIKNGAWSSWTVLGKTNEAKNSWFDDKAKSGVTYRYAIRAVDGKIRSGYVATSGMVFLEQPTLKIANASTGITGTWEKIDGAKGYTIYRSELVNGKWTKWLNLGTTKETAKSFTDKTVKSGSQYKYTVRAINGKVKSTYEATSSLMYITQPTLKVTNAEGGISGSWTQVKNAKGYTIYRAELVDGKWSNWVNLGTAKETAKSFTDKTAKAGATYRYTIRAINGKYKSSFVATTEIVVLSIPTVKTSNADKGVKVTWNKIAGAKEYTVYSRELKNGKWSAFKVLAKTDELSFVDSSAVSNNKYQYTVRAVNGSSRSLYKATATHYYLSTPTVSLDATETGIKVSWTKCAGAKGYTVYRASLNEAGEWSGWKNMGTAGEAKFSWVDKSVEEDVVYRYTVRAINEKYKSAYVPSEALVIEGSEEATTEPTTENTTNPAA